MFGKRGKWLLVVAFICLGLSPTAWAEGGNETGNGGVGIQIGGAVKVFDQVEYEEPMTPQSTGNPWALIDGQLRVLETKLPSTSRYLRGFFEQGKIVWWFVHATLKPTCDEGKTDLLITYRHEQIAAHNGMIVQIRKDIWDQLDDDAKATLLMHEMLWSALGSSYFGDASIIRMLSRYLLHPDLKNFSTSNIVSFLLQTMSMAQPPGAAANSPFLNYVFYDRRSAEATQPFTFASSPGGMGDETVATVVSPASPLKGMRVTPLRVNTAYPSVTWSSSTRAFSNGQTGSPLDARELCSSLQYGGGHNWRLPSRAEFTELRRLGILTQKYWAGEFWPAARQTANVPQAAQYSDVPAHPKLLIDSSLTLKCFEDNFQSCGTMPLYDSEDTPYFCVEGPAVHTVVAGEILSGVTYFVDGHPSSVYPAFGGSLIDQEACAKEKEKWMSRLRNAKLISLDCTVDGKQGEEGSSAFSFEVGEMAFRIQAQRPLSAYSIHMAMPMYEMLRENSFLTFGQDYDAAFSQYASRPDFVMETWDRPDGFIPNDLVGQVWLAN